MRGLNLSTLYDPNGLALSLAERGPDVFDLRRLTEELFCHRTRKAQTTPWCVFFSPRPLHVARGSRFDNGPTRPSAKEPDRIDIFVFRKHYSRRARHWSMGRKCFDK